MLYGKVRMSDGSERKVARLILGTTAFGTAVSREDAFRMMDMYWEAGGNAIDTARVYGTWVPGHEDGPSEKVVGEWVRSRGVGKDAFIITKGAHPPLSDMSHSRLTRQDILSDVEKSLDALGLDRIDLYYLHRDEAARPVEDIMNSLTQARRNFPICALGASNWKADRIRQANEWVTRAGEAGFSASELRWSYVDFPKGVGDQTLVTMDEGEYAAYKEMDVAVMAYSSQGNGLFLKGYAPDLGDVPPRVKPMATEENIRRYGALLDACGKGGVTPSRFVIRYITDDPCLNSFALVGCSKTEQLRQSLDAMRA